MAAGNAQTQTYDVVVIGGGAVGENLADRAVQGGLSAAIVESELVGGECSYWACMPSKALLRPGAALAAAEAVPGTGEVPQHVDVEATFAARDSFASDWNDESQVEWLSSAGIDLIRGTARIIGEREVEVNPNIEQAGVAPQQSHPTTVRARHAVAICTGTTPVLPPIEGLAESRPWTSAEATAATQVPPELLIIGGGVVGCEMATVFADLGARVHLIARGKNLLAGVDEFAGQAVGAALANMGVDVRLSCEVTSCAQVGADPTDLIGDDATSFSGIRTEATLSDGTAIVADQILVATGRKPDVPEITAGGIERDESGQVALDHDLRAVGTDWLYVVGDASGRAHTTHQGKYQARIIGDLIAQRANAPSAGSADLRADDLGPPQVIFTRPEVAHVGLSAAAAQEQGRNVQIFDQDLGAVAGAALHAHGYQGQVRFVVDVEQQLLIGATFVGQDVAEMLQAATTAIIGQVPLQRLKHVVPAYPTMSEVWLRFLEAAGW